MAKEQSTDNLKTGATYEALTNGRAGNRPAVLRFAGSDFDLFGAARRDKALRAGQYFQKVMRATQHGQPFDALAVRAQALYQRDKEYVVRNGEVVIVDEFTGRLQPGRRWSEGLHQAIEAKEGVAIQKESRTYASITYQNYFRLYGKLAGMTGTAKTSAEEF